MDDLQAGTLADLHTLMARPPRLRRGHTIDKIIASPAAGQNLAYKISSDYWERILAVAFLLTTSAAAGARAASITYAQGDGTVFSASPCGSGVGPSQTLQAYADLTGTPASAAAIPGAVSAAFAAGNAATATLPAGASLTGFTVTADQVTTVVSGTVTVSNVPGGPLAYDYVFPNGGNSPSVLPIAYPAALPPSGGAITVAINAVTGGAAGHINATYAPGGSAGAVSAYPQLPDLILKSGWQAGIQVAGIQAGDQISNVMIITEQYASNYADGALGSDEERQLRELLAAVTRGG